MKTVVNAIAKRDVISILILTLTVVGKIWDVVDKKK